MAVAVPDVSEVVIKAAFGGYADHLAGLSLFITPSSSDFGNSLALQPPLADGSGSIARGFQHRGQRVVVLQGLIELVVAHAGISLMNAGQQRPPRRRTCAEV